MLMTNTAECTTLEDARKHHFSEKNPQQLPVWKTS